MEHGGGRVGCEVHEVYRLKESGEVAYERDRRIELTVREGQGQPVRDANRRIARPGSASFRRAPLVGALPGFPVGVVGLLWAGLVVVVRR